MLLGRYLWALASVIGGCAIAACSQRTLPPQIADFDSGTPSPADGAQGSGGRSGSDGGKCISDASRPPSPDAFGYCGNMFLDVTSDPPNLYFVIDRSGSMGELADGQQKYVAVITAAASLVRSLGSRANVGATLFPGRGVGPDNPCVPGDEVFPTRPGDPLPGGSCADEGPVTQSFARAIGATPTGATPTGATLDKLFPTLSALPGKTVVLLATDGGPNCNIGISCDESGCIPNIERQAGCSPGINCCAPTGVYGPGNCLDGVGTRAAVERLFAKGIKTYVVGVPGSAPYAALLNDLAVAGGTARNDPPSDALYYDVQHVSELDDALAAIGATATASCQVKLATPPPNPAFVNVYLDGTLIKYGPDGWLWGPVSRDAGDLDGPDADDADDADDGSTEDVLADATSDADTHREIDLVGSACQMLTSGKYRRLQVVFGCPTDLPK